MFRLKKYLSYEHGRFRTDYALGIFVVVLVVISFWRIWCLFVIKLVNPICSRLASPGISTQHCNIKFDIDPVKEHIENWLENIPLPQIPQFDIELPPTSVIVAAIVVAAIIVIAILCAQIHSKQETIKRKIQGWYSAAITIWPFKRNRLVPLRLRLDVAVPDKVCVDRVFHLVAAIRQLVSPVLNEDDLSVVKSGPVQVRWPESQPFVCLLLQVSAPSCKIVGENSCSFPLWFKQDSPIFTFQLIPKEEGKISIVVTVLQEDDTLGTARVHTVASRVAGRVELETTSQRLKDTSPTKIIRKKTRKFLLDSLERERAFHIMNLRRFEETKAKHGPLGVPLHIQNAIDRTQEELKRVETRIQIEVSKTETD